MQGKQKKYNHFLLRWIEKLSLDLVLVTIIFIICLWVLLEISNMVFHDQNNHFDEQVFSMISPYINSRTTAIMQVITFFGSPYFLLPANIIMAGIFLFVEKKQRINSLKIASVALTSTAVLFLLKTLLQRQRPLVPLISKVHGYSFPSGHSFSSFVFFGMLAYIVFKNIKNNTLKWTLIVCCFLFTLLIGFSRIYLKLHFASDVIAGFCLGMIWLLLSKLVLLKTEKLIAPVIN